MKDHKNTGAQNDSKKKKPHYKKKQSGIYNKKASNKNKKIDSLIEELVVQAQHVADAQDSLGVPAAELKVTRDNELETTNENQSAEQTVQTAAESVGKGVAKEAKPKAPMTAQMKMLMQAAMAGAFVCMGLILLLSTVFLVYSPMRQSNKVLADQRLESRMELSLLISNVFPSMKVDDELSEMMLRAMENRKNTLRSEGDAVVGEINALRKDAQINEILTTFGYADADFSSISGDEAQAKTLLEVLSTPIGMIDARLEELGVAKLKEDIAMYKGTTTTTTREDENGQVITETVTTGGLLPEVQAKKDELQKKYDDIQGKLDQLDAYISDNQGKITSMYNRLEDATATDNIYTKIEAITAYVKANPKENIFLTDIDEKLASFPGESKEEDDILFIMKIESETGIKMQTINYGQDYQHKQLSNGMLLCYEVYSIPYYATYQGMKNLIAYFNDNDDFYGSVYTLSMQYNPANESIQGAMVILHYYLLEKDAEYVPPVIDEVITPGIDGIFGDVTDNGLHGKQSDHTADEVEQWLKDGMTLEEVRDRIKTEGYPATELAWILKEKYKTTSEIQGFMDQYGEDGVDYGKKETLEAFFECDIFTLLEIYNYQEPEDTTGGETPADPEDTTGGETPADPEDTTGGETPADPEDTTGGETPADPEETIGDENADLSAD